MIDTMKTIATPPAAVDSNETRFYLSGPFEHHDPQVRHGCILFTQKVAMDLISTGCKIYSPILWDYGTSVGDWAGESQEGTSCPLNIPILSACDSLLILCLKGWENSIRLAAEIQWATEHEKSVFFLSPSNPRRFFLQPEPPHRVDLSADESHLQCKIRGNQPWDQDDLMTSELVSITNRRGGGLPSLGIRAI
jgi:hypothetical protein